ncbi:MULTISPECIES: replicative DNA helicase [Thermotoga]|jgi:replicative DNA helicase|uniref:Replicative DNA helicase n=4 Tax=Thermotoga TaxID=2335 RepID=Q9X258_THEMA|nr:MULTISPECIES: replicative DNA helicase [Thermotoga]KUK23817.1 MAG: Primary replicative DNA helicase [Thermotoga petrophila]KUK33684.1 MAG: Primary replicative DNA helicase [Thermotoga sp. 47_83]MBZ4661551.1 helicase [Thermotoga sp.]AAD36801.1 replicative DNA helicase [Thermotoga maritima MSB8]ABQ47049.1 primary replicative DNA helicase [Thermotoga petrophila RKU-1]
MRVPPHNLEAEVAVLGSILIDPSVINDVLEILSHEDFYLKKHQHIFRAMEELYDEGKPVDVVSVCDKLQSMGKLEEVGGDLEVAQLAEAVPSSAHALHYAEIVKEKSILRKLIEISRKISESAYMEEDVEILLDNAEKMIFEISEMKTTKSYDHLRGIMHRVFENLENFRERANLIEPGVLITGLPTGFKSLDKQTTGFHSSDLVIIAARPSMGKTSFALSIARNMAVNFEIPVGIFSLEMSKEQLAQRLLSMESGVDLYSIRTGYLDQEKWERLTIAASKLYKAPIVVDDESLLDPRSLRAKARRMKKEYDVKAIFVDYLQLMHLKGRKESRQQEISEISRSLKLLARELDIVVIALSQLSRAVEQREDKRPRLSDLRESGAIEQDADTVIFIYREEYYRSKKSKEESKLHEPHEAEIIIGKQRNGPVGTITLIFDPRTVTFHEVDVVHS